MRTLRLSLLAMVLGATPAAWTQASAPDPEAARWLERARLMTISIQQDSAKLRPDLQYLALTRLAEIWRKTDPQRANEWLKNAVAEIVNPPAGETPAEGKSRFEAGNAIAPGIFQTDRAAADQLLDWLTMEANRATAEGRSRGRDGSQEQMNLGATLGEMVQPLDRPTSLDTASVLELGRRMLAIGDGNHLMSVYYTLRRSAPEKAAIFAGEALQAARSDNFMLVGVSNLANVYDRMPEEMRPPDELRAQIRQLLAQSFLRPPTSAKEKSQTCMLASSLTRLIDQYSPDQKAALKTALDACRAEYPRVDQSVRNMEQMQRTTNDAEPVSSTEMSAARDAHERGQLKLKGVRDAETARDFARALDLLDGFTREEREGTPAITWEMTWSQVALSWVGALYEAGDTAGIQQVIRRAPDSRRAWLMMAVSAAAFRKKDAAYGITMLMQAERDLDARPNAQPSVYLRLLTLYADNAPEQLTRILPLAVRGINDYKQPEAKEVGGVRLSLAPLGTGFRYVQLSPRLLDIDSAMLDEQIGNLKVDVTRLAFRLDLLRQCLDRYERMRSPAKGPEPTAS